MNRRAGQRRDRTPIKMNQIAPKESQARPSSLESAASVSESLKNSQLKLLDELTYQMRADVGLLDIKTARQQRLKVYHASPQHRPTLTNCATPVEAGLLANRLEQSMTWNELNLSWGNVLRADSIDLKLSQIAEPFGRIEKPLGHRSKLQNGDAPHTSCEYVCFSDALGCVFQINHFLIARLYLARFSPASDFGLVLTEKLAAARSSIREQLETDVLTSLSSSIDGAQSSETIPSDQLESEVIKQLLQGCDAQDIAHRVHTSTEVIDQVIHTLCHRLNLHSIDDLRHRMQTEQRVEMA